MMNQRCESTHMWWALARWHAVRVGNTLQPQFQGCMTALGYPNVTIEWLEGIRCK